MSGIEIVYDGDCPFCSRYVVMTRLRASVGEVRLIDARSGDPIVAEIRDKGYDLNQGMLARYEGREYFGSDCVHLLSMLSSRSGLLNRFCSIVFSNKAATEIMYPFMRAGRNATLRILGRPLIP